MKLSVIIPAHNEEKNIGKTVRNIKEQLDIYFNETKEEDYQGELIDFSGKNFEIIVVCDSCDDDTANVARKAGATRILNVRNKKVALTRNDGADIAEGEYLLFLDADTHIVGDFITNGVSHEGAIRQSIEKLDTDNNISVIASYWENEEDDSPRGTSIFKFLANWFMYLTNTGGGYYLMCRREEFIPFSEKVKNEDIDWCEEMKSENDGKVFLLKNVVKTSMRRLEEKGMIATVWFYMSKEVCFTAFKILLKMVMIIIAILAIIYTIKNRKELMEKYFKNDE